MLMVKLLKPKYPMYRETVKSINIEQYPVGDSRRMELILDAMRNIRRRKWWQRINWKLKEVEQ
jgi:hypothetical protein